MLGSSFTLTAKVYLMKFATPGALSAMTQNSNGIVQYSYVTKHPVSDILSHNYFIHAAHFLSPGDSIKVMVETQLSLRFAELVVLKVSREEVIIADWHALNRVKENGVTVVNAPFRTTRDENGDRVSRGDIRVPDRGAVTAPVPAEPKKRSASRRK